MHNLFFKDNNPDESLWSGGEIAEDKRNEVLESINKIANKSLVDLSKSNSDLLVFPTSFNTFKDDIHKKPIFNLNSENKIQTYNLMGFVGKDDVKITIGSRFDNGDKQQYFMQYILQKVFAINLVDLNTSAENENIWDFLLMYMFPYYLNKALRQGLYKEYKKVKHNNANVKGTIDIARHIRQNIPFAGNIAYNTREFSYDNPTTQLIRHTIEYIISKNQSNALKNESNTVDNVKLIRAATPTYTIRERQAIISKNNKSINHPYFTEYEDLKLICLKILSYEGLSFAHSKERVHGILFDGAWLWEEYLNTILMDCGFHHPENKVYKDGVCLFYRTKEYVWYPDFYSIDKSIVIDAKYKHLNRNKTDNKDMHQVISYMYILKSEKGWLLYPNTENKVHFIGNLIGYGGQFYTYGMKIPANSNSFDTFSEEMKGSEIELRKKFNE